MPPCEKSSKLSLVSDLVRLGPTPKFGLIGAAGFVAPRHLAAIKAVGGEVVAICDPNDSVGVIGKYFKNALYFRDIELFEHSCLSQRVDYISICSPNYLHQHHIELANRIGATAICEKPAVLNSSYLFERIKKDKLGVYFCYQLRYNSSVVEALKRFKDSKDLLLHITYHTPRGHWYSQSWKADRAKSGGLAFNIGIHLFDLAQLFCGEELMGSTYMGGDGINSMKGMLFFRDGQVHFDLSIDNNLPLKREFEISSTSPADKFSIDLSNNFEDLHTLVYRDAIVGRGVGAKEAYPSVKIAETVTRWYT